MHENNFNKDTEMTKVKNSTVEKHTEWIQFRAYSMAISLYRIKIQWTSGIMRILEKKEKDSVTEDIFKVIRTENFLN